MTEYITYEWYYDSRARKISSVIKDHDEIVGAFTLTMMRGDYPPQLSVDIEEEYQGRNFSKILLKNFHNYIYYNWNNSRGVYILTDNNRKSRPYIELDQDMLIYIDTDASGNSRGSSWWRHIVGMSHSRYASNAAHSHRNVDAGYELNITLRDLLQNIWKMRN